jgi:hypothetical protein
MAQLSYELDIPVGFEGQLADANALDSISRLAEGTDLSFGRGVQLGTDKDGQVKAPAAAMAIASFVGVIQHRPTTDGLVAEKSSQSILRKGRIYVEVEETVAPGDAVFLILQNGTVGRFQKTDGTADTLDVSAKCSWIKGAASGEVAILEINL